MKTQDTHIIHKVFVEVDSNSSTKANDIRLNANSFIETNVLTIVEEYIATIESRLKNVTVQIDPLHLNLKSSDGMIGKLDMKLEIEKQLDAIFLPILRSVESSTNTKIDGVKIEPIPSSSDSPSKSEIEVLSPEMRSEKSILYFIRTGKAPWWISKHETLRKLLEEESLLEIIDGKPNATMRNNFIVQLIPLLKREVIRKRIIRQFGNNVLARLITAIRRQQISSSSSETLSKSSRMEIEKSFIQLAETLSAHQRLILTDRLLLQLSYRKPVEVIDQELDSIVPELVGSKKREEFLEIATKILPSNDSINTESKEGHQEESLKQSDPIEETFDSGILTENAGLVLLTPFLKPFLKNIKLLNEEGSLTDPVLAAHTLHFLATGIEEDFEFAMVIEAWLCGLPIDEPLPKSVELSDEIKQACHELLSAVLKHWEALKSTSIPLLRKEFLQRDGKLILNEVAPRIVVERTTIDVLLDKIPWGFSIIKLPWLEDMMYVEW